MTKGMLTHRQNHLERQELIKKNKVAAGLVAERFPGISLIVFHLTYYQKGAHPVLMVRTVNFTPADYAYFHMDCLREGCANGGFDLAPVVASLIRDQKKTVKGKLSCDGKSDSVAPHHASIAYEVTVQSAQSAKILK